MSDDQGGTFLVPATPGGLDFVSLGAVVLRLDPGIVPFQRARHVALHVSGGEYNVAANLAACFGLRAAIATAHVQSPVGALVDERIRAMGVVPIYRSFPHDGTQGPNVAIVFSDRGYGVRAPVVFYNRSDEAAALLGPGAFDWRTIFAGGGRWFHSGGIFAALSPATADLIVEGMEAAQRAGATVSFDLNYRDRIWASKGGRDRARAVLTRIVEHVDVLVGNEEDLQRGLGIEGPSVTAGDRLDPRTFLTMIAHVTRRFPRLRAVATTLREVQSANRHRWSAVAWVEGRAHVAPVIELDVFDRVGGGDGFAAGFFYGLLAGMEAEDALRFGWAHGALVTTYPGDTTMATLADVEALAHQTSARIQR